MDPSAAPVDPCRCPLCGQPNACANEQAGGGRRPACWCTGLTFRADLLARVPPAAQRRACICERCARAAPP